jgi:signal transduction histidine kinase
MIRPLRTDALIALALAAGAALEASLSGGGFSGEAVAAAAVCVPVAWRRAAPTAALIGCSSALVVASVTDSGIENSLPIAAFVLAVFSFAARATRGDALRIGALTVLLVEGAILINPTDTAVADAIFTAIAFLALPFAAGRLLHARTALTSRLAEQARLLEAEREAQAARAAADERTRMAGELHDLVAAGVREMLDAAAVAEVTVDDDRGRCADAIAGVELRGRDTLVEMRRLLGVLRREDEDLALAPQPSLARLGDLVGLLQRGGREVTLAVEGEPHPLTPGVDVAAYRVVEETLAAAAPARHADVAVRWRDAAVELEVACDGEQLAEPAALAATRERVSLFGGRLRAGRRPRGGSALVAELPTREREAVR